MKKTNRPKSRTVLVTGGAGFIGSHVAEAYLSRGWTVTVVDDLSTGRRENVPDGVDFIEIDVRDPGLLDVFDGAGGFELISHHAAQVDVRKSVSRPAFDAEVNIMGLLNVIEGARSFGTRRLIFVSSGGVVYGDVTEHRPIPEETTKAPASPYGVSKLVSEYYLRCFGELDGFDYVALRYSNVYGPRQDPHGEAGVVAIFSERIAADRPLTIYGDGEQTRDYVYVGDVVEANLHVSERAIEGGADLDDRAFNVGTGVETSVNELAARLMEAAGRQVEVGHEAPRPGELQWNSLDTGKLRRLGWTPRTGLSEGLSVTYRHIAESSR